jgi:hypothetical protein
MEYCTNKNNDYVENGCFSCIVKAVYDSTYDKSLICSNEL